VQSDLECRFLRVVPGAYPIALSMSEGVVAPLFSSAVGIAIVSQMGDDDIASLVERTNRRTRQRSKRVDLATIMKAVVTTREHGYAVVYGALFPDTGAVAAPFPSEANAFPMAIGVGGLQERIRRNELAIARTLRATMLRVTGRNARARRARRTDSP
jgi:DNA-binding IclR family transcriptional regulator